MRLRRAASAATTPDRAGVPAAQRSPTAVRSPPRLPVSMASVGSRPSTNAAFSEPVGVHASHRPDVRPRPIRMALSLVISAADADLIGIPQRIVIGERKLGEGKVELKRRHEAAPRDLPPDQAIELVRSAFLETRA